MGSLPAGAPPRVLTVNCVATAPFSERIRVDVVSDQFEEDPDSAKAELEVTALDRQTTGVAVDVVVEPGEIGHDPAGIPVFLIGDGVDVVFTVTNHESVELTEVGVGIDMTSGLRHVSHQGRGSFASPTGVWSVGRLGSGESAVLRMVVEVERPGLHTISAEPVLLDSAIRPSGARGQLLGITGAELRDSEIIGTVCVETHNGSLTLSASDIPGQSSPVL